MYGMIYAKEWAAEIARTQEARRKLASTPILKAPTVKKVPDVKSAVELSKVPDAKPVTILPTAAPR